MSHNIKFINIFGERCSGTNYLQQLLKINFSANIQHFYKSHQKHFHIGKEIFNDPEDLEQHLFVIIARNPWDWLRSLHIKKHHFPTNIRRMTFSQYLRTQWYSVYNDSKRNNQEMSQDHNPETKQRYANVLKMRSGKYSNFLNIQEWVPNFYYINYDDLIKNSDKIINDISQTYNLILKYNVVSNINNLCRPGRIDSQKYKKRKFKQINDNDLEFIRNELDWEIENKLGYFSDSYLK